MNIKQIDNLKNLFEVKDVFSHDLLDKIETIDLWNNNYNRQLYFPEYQRRTLLIEENSLLHNIEKYCYHLPYEIEKITSLIFESKNCKVDFWLDYQDFYLEKHYDSDDLNPYISMQIYLLNINGDFGTSFFKDDGILRYSFPCVQNTGYMMINQNKKNLLHGLINRVPANVLRLSVCIRFGKFKYK